MIYRKIAMLLSILLLTVSLQAQTLFYVLGTGSCNSTGGIWDLHADWGLGSCVLGDDLFKGPIAGKITDIVCRSGAYGPTWDIVVYRSVIHCTCQDFYYVASSWTSNSCQKNSLLEFAQPHTVCD